MVFVAYPAFFCCDYTCTSENPPDTLSFQLWRTGCWAFYLEHDSLSTRLSLLFFSYKQHDFTILDLLTTVLPATCEEWDWGARSPRVPSAVAQQRPIWPIGAKPSSATGSLIMNTPTLALAFSIGWITIAEDGFCSKRKMFKSCLWSST